MSDTDYVAAVDDSGGIEPLATWNGTPVAGDHPITVLATGVIKSSKLEEFEGRWNDLRLEIKKELACAQLPPIHMRLMWGKDLKKTYRGGPNPYLGTDFEQIKRWYSKSLQIIYDLNREPRTIGFWTFVTKRIDEAARHTRYFQSPEFLAEMLFIRSHSRGKRFKKMYKGYHNRITSPLLPLFANGLPYLNEAMNVADKKTVRLLVDPFGDAHGVDAKDVYSAISTLNQLSQIVSVERVENADDQPICQAVDVVGFTSFRGKMAEFGYINHDVAMMQIYNRFPLKPFSTANLNHIVSRKYPDLASRQMTIHYAIAREHISTVDPTFAVQHMISIEEFYKRAKILAPEDIGVSVLKDSAACADFLANLRNDEDRG